MAVKRYYKCMNVMCKMYNIIVFKSEDVPICKICYCPLDFVEEKNER